MSVTMLGQGLVGGTSRSCRYWRTNFRSAQQGWMGSRWSVYINYTAASSTARLADHTRFDQGVCLKPRSPSRALQMRLSIRSRSSACRLQVRVYFFGPTFIFKRILLKWALWRKRDCIDGLPSLWQRRAAIKKGRPATCIQTLQSLLLCMSARARPADLFLLLM
jgi:hypothetical protein